MKTKIISNILVFFGFMILASLPIAVKGQYEAAPEGYDPGAYTAPIDNYNPGACPANQYRNGSGNCVPYDGGYEANPNYQAETRCGNGFEEIRGVCFPSNTNLPDPSGGVVQIITNVLNWLLGIFGILAIIAFVISGIQYILSAGDEKMIDTAKRNMTWSIVGVVVALAGMVIIFAIDKMLRGTANF